MSKTCIIEGCGNIYQARGYCHTHYEYYRKKGKIKKLPIGGRKCSIDGCDNIHSGRGYCAKHLNKFKRFGNPLHVKEKLPEFCKIEGCQSKRISLGFCLKHYKRFSKHGDPLFINPKHEEHGFSKSEEYSSWRHMRERCNNKNHKHYENYGGRGIIVCKEWNKYFSSFLKDIGEKPFSGAEIDRKNNDGNYEPGNCRWTTRLENARNRGNIKKSIEIARNIRKDFKNGYTRKKLSVKYNSDYSDICRIVKNELWKE